jgi:hypothetical protein
MKVKLRYKTKDGHCYGTITEIDLSQAKKIYKEKLDKDDNIIEVYCIRFDGWHWYRSHILKSR